MYLKLDPFERKYFVRTRHTKLWYQHEFDEFSLILYNTASLPRPALDVIETRTLKIYLLLFYRS